jgi:hypothetical protein
MPAQKPSGAPLPKVPMASANATRMATGIIVGLIVGGVAGYGAGRVSVGPSAETPRQKGSYQEGYEAAKKKLAESGLFPPAPTETRVLAGKVISVDGNSLVIEVDLRSANPLEEFAFPKRRTVRITDATKIIEQVNKPTEEFQKELAKFQKDSQGGRVATPPQPYIEKPVALGDLKAGQEISVISEVNILAALEFDASTIIVSNAGLVPLSTGLQPATQTSTPDVPLPDTPPDRGPNAPPADAGPLPENP